jgi:hypothetical protein
MLRGLGWKLSAGTRAIALLFIFALLCRLLYIAALWHVLPIWSIDAHGYHSLALNLVQRGAFSMNAEAPFQPDALRTPGYPLFITLIYALFVVAPRAVIVAQAFLDSITALLVMGIAYRLTRSTRAAWLAGAVYAIYPTAWHYSLELFVETPLAFTLALFFLIALTPGRWQAPWLGLVCAISLLVKPNVLALPPIAVAILVASSLQKVRQSRQDVVIPRLLNPPAVFTITLLAVLSPWIARNALVFGRPMLSTVFEFNLAYVSAPFTLAEARGQDIGMWSREFGKLYSEVYHRAAQRDPALFTTPIRKMTPRQLDQVQRELADVASEIVRANPRAFIAGQLSGISRAWRPYDHYLWFTHLTGKNWDGTVPVTFLSMWIAGQTVSRLAVTLYLAFYCIYGLGMIATLAGVWRLLRTSTAATRAVIFGMSAMIIYMTLLPGPIAYDRFRVPIMPLVCALMAGAFDWLLCLGRHIQSRNTTLAPCSCC